MAYDTYLLTPDRQNPLHWATFGVGIGDSVFPFYVGNAPIEDVSASQPAFCEPVVAGSLQLDELRISSAPRGPDGLAEPLALDDQTLALWHFDEARNARMYMNAADPQTLRLDRGGLRPVPSGTTIATQWGAIKQKAQR